MIRLIIAGSRAFEDYQLLRCEVLMYIIEEIQHKNIEIVSGTASGADKLGEKFAIQYNFPIKRFPADWDKYGKSAGYKRNEEMAKYATHCIVFWDGKSRGTKHMIDLAKKYGLNLKIHGY